MKTFEYTLSDPVKFHKGGSTEETTLLVFQAPSAKNRRKVSRLKQGFMQAVSSIKAEGTDAKKEGKAEDIKPQEILSVLQMSDIDYESYVETFFSLVTDGICKVDGSEVSLTGQMLDEVSCDDLDKIMGEYLVNFIIGSLGG